MRRLRDAATDRAVRRLAKLKRKTLTETIREACQHEYERECSRGFAVPAASIHRRWPFTKRCWGCPLPRDDRCARGIRRRRFIVELDGQAIPITPEIGRMAVETFARYGRGNHPARLNMGDRFAYACARSLGVPLLCKGGDFSQTDIAVA